MARLEYKGFEILQNQIEQLSRTTIRRLVEAGANALIESTQESIESYHHVVTGTMKTSVKAGKYHETLGGGWMDVYPQGDDNAEVGRFDPGYVNQVPPKQQGGEAPSNSDEGAENR